MLTHVQMTNATGVIVFDQPARRNALSKPLVDEAIAALEPFKAARTRPVVVRAAGDLSDGSECCEPGFIPTDVSLPAHARPIDVYG